MSSRRRVSLRNRLKTAVTFTQLIDASRRDCQESGSSGLQCKRVRSSCDRPLAPIGHTSLTPTLQP
eukprot:6864543-Prymnesium_polylepis.1